MCPMRSTMTGTINSVATPIIFSEENAGGFKIGYIRLNNPRTLNALDLSMLRAMESAVTGREFLLGDRFSMADVIFGGTVRYMLRFKMLEARPAFVAYNDRLGARPALQRADARNLAIAKEHGLAT